MPRLIPTLVCASSLLVAACTTAASGSSAASSAPATSARATGTSPAAPESSESSESSSGTSDGTGRAADFTPWWTYHRTAARSGHAAHGVGTPLKPAWSKDLGQAVYGEPLVVGSTLIAATEGNRVFGLNARTGKVRWRTGLGSPQPQSGLPCGDIDPLGITGTPAYDPDTGSVFAVAETVGGRHTLWALDARTGAKQWHRSLDVLPDRNRKAEQERSAVLVEHGRVVVSFGGLAGDCDDYVGYVTSTSTTGAGRTFHYAVPTAREAGMWAPPGPVLGRNGHVYVASGNGAELHGRWDKSDSVTELTSKRLHRVSVFAPKTWRDDNIRDLDLGSMSPMPVPSLHRIVIAGKRGVVYLLHERFHGVGSAITKLDGCHAFSGAARVGRTVLMPCLGEGQVRELRVTKTGLRWGWSASAFGAPVVAGSRVYVSDRESGDLVVLRLSNGSVVQRIAAGSHTHFPSVTVDGGYVFVPTLDGVQAFHG
jgi:outer membrane protein assembly factor BamB